MRHTFSGLQRLAVCPASGVLPRTQTVTPPAERGSALHAFLADLASGLSEEQALARVPEEYRDACESMGDVLEQVPVEAVYEAEVSLTYQPETGMARWLGKDLARAYVDIRENEVVGTVDLLGIASDAVVVIDWKTGRGNAPSPSRNWQLRAAALAAATLYRRSKAVLAICRRPEGESPFWDVAELDAFGLDDTAAELRAMLARVTPDAKPVLGEHCRYCPSFLHCPAQAALVRRMAAEPEAVGRDIRALITPENARLAYQRVKLVREAMKQVEAAIHAYASEHPIDLGDGVVFGPTETRWEELDGGVAYEVLQDLFGLEVADNACEKSTSKAAIERALRKYALTGESVAELKRRALEEIRAAGGARVRTSASIREHRPREDAEEAQV